MINKALIMQELQRLIGHVFAKPKLLELALTHKSANSSIDSNYGLNNERLEFLGDAVLSLVAANYIFCHFTSCQEGDLSKMRALFVCQENLSKTAQRLGLGQYITSDKSTHASGATNTKSILADALEAIIGAVFIDAGYHAAEKVVFNMLGYPVLAPKSAQIDAKTKLQEIVQASCHKTPKYTMISADGPDHAPVFTMGVSINDEILAEGQGSNKKIAMQHAAEVLLEKLSS